MLHTYGARVRPPPAGDIAKIPAPQETARRCFRRHYQKRPPEDRQDIRGHEETGRRPPEDQDRQETTSRLPGHHLETARRPLGHHLGDNEETTKRCQKFMRRAPGDHRRPSSSDLDSTATKSRGLRCRRNATKPRGLSLRNRESTDQTWRIRFGDAGGNESTQTVVDRGSTWDQT